MAKSSFSTGRAGENCREGEGEVEGLQGEKRVMNNQMPSLQNRRFPKEAISRKTSPTLFFLSKGWRWG